MNDYCIHGYSEEQIRNGRCPGCLKDEIRRLRRALLQIHDERDIHKSVKLVRDFVYEVLQTGKEYV